MQHRIPLDVVGLWLWCCCKGSSSRHKGAQCVVLPGQLYSLDVFVEYLEAA